MVGHQVTVIKKGQEHQEYQARKEVFISQPGG